MRKFAFLLLLPLLFLLAEETELADAPDFTLEDVDGNTVCLDSLLAKGPVFMSFWALWCKMCIKELDALKPYYDEFDSLGINLLAISQDKKRAVPKVKPFALSHKWKYVVVLDPDNIMRELYQVQAMPTSFIIDQNKKIVFTHQGYKPGDEEIIIKTMRELFEKGEGNDSEE
ncbi:MAG TPA: TlpA family protein disulfide reductase [candidate division WOR-3 bacterium]|uniref:TlpA family protein disulfide reductase n=1 Tax=candidate division WOR-3 bacterium TaxID=2052148 RepID=A0A9C9JZF1_UNCW3|nr:TlpA family protein disulfide reductase [candidate division WOR-3 bacterium]